MDYDPHKKKCVCGPHPCWNDDGQEHRCVLPDFPYLHFTYDEDSKLQCSCSSIARTDSVYMSRELCPGHYCEKEDHPILDWREDEGGCVCSSHPCWSDNGQRHSCLKPGFPILQYREEKMKGGGGKGVCECGAKMDPPAAVNQPRVIEEPEEDESTEVYDYDYDDEEF